MKNWLELGSVSKEDTRTGLFMYTAQSNLNGRRFPLDLPARAREAYPGWYCLLDAPSYLTTTALNFPNVPMAPDFTVVSFYKIFGYPDLGAIIVKKYSGIWLFNPNSSEAGVGYNIPRKTLHEALEDETLPFHNVLALEHPFNNFGRLFGAHIRVARHTSLVARLAHNLLALSQWSSSLQNIFDTRSRTHRCVQSLCREGYRNWICRVRGNLFTSRFCVTNRGDV